MKKLILLTICLTGCGAHNALLGTIGTTEFLREVNQTKRARGLSQPATGEPMDSYTMREKKALDDQIRRY